MKPVGAVRRMAINVRLLILLSDYVEGRLAGPRPFESQSHFRDRMDRNPKEDRVLRKLLDYLPPTPSGREIQR